MVVKAAPVTGKLVAKDREIAAVARAVLGDTVRHVDGTDLTGLVIVLPVKDGLVEGSAAVHVDLHAEKLNPEVARRSEEALAFARAKYGSIKIAEATFVHGRLNGVATVWAPAGKAGAPMKVAEVTFRDHQLHGPAIEYWLGTTTEKRELAFEAGAQVGPYRTFHENGKPSPRRRTSRTRGTARRRPVRERRAARDQHVGSRQASASTRPGTRTARSSG